MKQYESDTKGKQIASQVVKAILGVDLHPTNDFYNQLDASFKWHGNIYGLEIKNVSTARYIKYDDVIIAQDKYEYSIGEGRDNSGLTTTYMLTFTEFPEETKIMIVDFSLCSQVEPRIYYAPTSHAAAADYKNRAFYSIPRSKARKYRIIDNQIIEDEEG